MSIQRFTELTCDTSKCGRLFTRLGEVGEVRDIAETCGWRYEHPGRDYCPNHPTPEES